MLRSGWRPLAPLITLLVLIWLGFRITQGVDLSDESYYAVFLDVWLKEGIRASPFLTLHQTAALIIYPAVRLFWQISGSTDGLILFLRAIYVVGALVAALSAAALFQRLGNSWTGWLAAALVLAFIPYGLPAPSYNTLGEQATIAALAGCGCAVLSYHGGFRAWVFWLVFSTAAWGVATVAYPSLTLALGVLFVCLFIVLRPPRPVLLAYTGLAVGFQTAGLLCVVGLLTWSHIRESIVYQSGIAGTLDIGKKISLVADVGLQNLGFTMAATTAVLIGVLRAHLRLSTVSIATVSLFIFLWFMPTALFVHSHDAVLIAALTGLGLLTGLRPGATLATRVIATIYAVSLAAGLATAATATYGLFSFPVGGLFAAVIAVVPSTPRDIGYGTLVPGAALLVLLFGSSASFYYGEHAPLELPRRERITGGAYAGLAASEETAQLIRIARTALQRWSTADDTIVVVGRLPGLYLLTEARPRALTPFPLTALATPNGLAATYKYYDNPLNRPSIVAAYTDPYFEPISPFGAKFDEWYELVDQTRSPLGALIIFRRRGPH
jgi:hypothetical protein